MAEFVLQRNDAQKGLYTYSDGESELTVDRELSTLELENVASVEDIETIVYTKAQIELDNFLQEMFAI